MCPPCNSLTEKPYLLCGIFYPITFCNSFSRSESDSRCAFLRRNTWSHSVWRSVNGRTELSDFQFQLLRYFVEFSIACGHRHHSDWSYGPILSAKKCSLVQACLLDDHISSATRLHATLDIRFCSDSLRSSVQSSSPRRSCAIFNGTDGLKIP